MRIYADPEYFSGQRAYTADHLAAVSEQGIRESARSLREVRCMKPPPARLLDVGCATGAKLKAAQRLGYEVAGVELSPYAATVARRLGLDVYNGELIDAPFAEQSFDVIMCSHVLEHVAQPSRLIQRCHQLMRLGGILVVEVPDFGSLPARHLLMHWPHYKPMEHIHYFEQQSLAALLGNSGFKAFQFRRDGLLSVFELWPFRKGTRGPLPSAGASPSCHSGLFVRFARRVKAVVSWLPGLAQGIERLAFRLLPIHDFLRVYARRN